MTLIGVALFTGSKLLAQKGAQYAKETFSFQIHNARIHKLNLSGFELRLSIDITNLSNLSGILNKLNADIYYLKDGAPSLLGKIEIAKGVKLLAKKTTRINDIKLELSYQQLLSNYKILTDKTRAFKAIINGSINGKEISTTQTFEA